MYCPRPSERSVALNRKRGHVLTIAQIRHMASLVSKDKRPDDTYSFEERVMWEMFNMLKEDPKRFA